MHCPLSGSAEFVKDIEDENTGQEVRGVRVHCNFYTERDVTRGEPANVRSSKRFYCTISPIPFYALAIDSSA